MEYVAWTLVALLALLLVIFWFDFSDVKESRDRFQKQRDEWFEECARTAKQRDEYKFQAEVWETAYKAVYAQVEAARKALAVEEEPHGTR